MTDKTKINEEQLSKLSPGKQAIVWVGQSMDCCFPPPFHWGAYAAFYLTLARDHPELADYLLKETYDTPDKPNPAVIQGIATLVEDSKDWFR